MMLSEREKNLMHDIGNFNQSKLREFQLFRSFEELVDTSLQSFLFCLMAGINKQNCLACSFSCVALMYEKNLMKDFLMNYE